MAKQVIKRRVVREIVPAIDEVVEQNITVVKQPARKVLRTPATLAEAVGSPAVLVREKPGKKKVVKKAVRVKRPA